MVLLPIFVSWAQFCLLGCCEMGFFEAFVNKIEILLQGGAGAYYTNGANVDELHCDYARL